VLLSLGNGSPAPETPAANVGQPSEAALHGRLIRVPLPITGEVDTIVKRSVERALGDLEDHPAGTRPVLIFEFWPKQGTVGQGSQFERSLALARFIASEKLNRVRTVAYVPRTIKGHAVLPVMACEQIIMHPEAELGDAGIDETSIDPTVRRGYDEIADRRRTIPSAVALGMLEPKLTASKVDGDKFVLGDELARLQREGTVSTIETLIPAKEMGLFTGRELRLELGFVSHLVTDRRELADVLELPLGELDVDPSGGEPWQAIRVEISGPLSDRLAGRIQRSIEDRMRVEDVNFVLVDLNSPGGSASASSSLASFFANFDGTRVRSVAYVDVQARADAALIAMACDHVVMHPQAVLGGPGAKQFRESQIDALTKTVQDGIARQKAKSWSLWAAMINPELEVFQFTRKGTGIQAYFCQEELDSQVDPTVWIRGDLESTPGEPFRVMGLRAEELGLARYLASNRDELRGLYGIDHSLEMVKPNWAHELIDALASPTLAWSLLFIGGFALMSELMSPGLGFPGFLASICFLLFFWSQFLQGTAGWLEVLLFATGIFFIALEIFVIPGFGIFGLGGGAMVIASLVLAMQTFVIPRNQYQLDQLPISLLTVAATLGGVVAALFIMRHFLPNTPVVSAVMLTPPEGDELTELARRESMVDFSGLVGKRGTATTRLVPAGKAMFEDELIDVISDGDLISKWTVIEVVEVHGNRVVVQEAAEPTT